ncbi:cytochrome P450 [Mycena capillaripes]|nr:cytochrome P450 [Mycena capillaripes]
MALFALATSITATFGVYILYSLLKVLYQEFTSPLRNVPGPKSDHWFLGNRLEIFKRGEDNQEGLWTARYGRTVRINTLLGFSQLYTTDTKAIQHILSNSYLYQKPILDAYLLGRLVGQGVLVVEGDVHKKQRKIMNPAFGPAQLRALTEIFVEKFRELRDMWADRAAQSGGVARVDVIPGFNFAALDMIGQAGKFSSLFSIDNHTYTGFNYNFKSLGAGSHGALDELHEAFATLSDAANKPGPLDFVKGLVPSLRRVLPRRNIDKVIEGSKAVLRRIGQRLLLESKQKIADGSSADSTAFRDLLSLLVRANTAKDIPEAQRLSDPDVLAQVPTFLAAGHETTSAAATWALFSLAKNKEIQTRLRNELLGVDNENPSMDELNSLPYLDCVVRETLRVHAPVPAAFRAAVQDDIILLGTPYTDRNGTVHEAIRLTKGQTVVLPILALNRDPAIWGPDAHEFIPERWERNPPISTSIPGVWSHMFTFLGGPHACIGYRFALVELKALLFMLVRGLEFQLAVPATDIGRLPSAIVQLPAVRSDRAAGAQMPLLIKPFTQL